jgi:hypothetical protein
VASSCEYGDEPLGSGATELVKAVGSGLARNTDRCEVRSCGPVLAGSKTAEDCGLELCAEACLRQSC